MAPLDRAGQVGLTMAALLIACAVLPAAASQYCVVDARLDPGGSARIGGDITSPLAAELKTNDAAKVSGSVTIVFPTGGNPRRGGRR
jgi:hypothetical protein